MRVVLVVAGLGAHTTHVINAVRAESPDARIDAVWAGDPQLRPAPPTGSRWIDTSLAEPTGVGWGLLAVALRPSAYQLARALRAVASVACDEPTVVVRVGAVAVVAGLAPLTVHSGIGLAPRARAVPPNDGLLPSIRQLAMAGRYSTAVLSVAPDAAADLQVVADAVAAAAPESTGGAELDAAVRVAGIALTELDAVACARWGLAAADLDPSAVVIDVEALDPDDEAAVAVGNGPQRVRLSETPVMREAIARTNDQWRHAVDPLRLPGGITIDATMRKLTSSALEDARLGVGSLPPDPFGESGAAFVEWLETPWPPWGADLGRYWTALHASRPDLQAAFPHPGGTDRERFADWARNRWRYEPTSPVLRPVARRMRPAWRDADHRPGGINLVGYLGFDNSLGDVARRVHAALLASGEPVAALHYHRSGSPPSPDAPELADTLVYDTNLIVINADQLPLLAADHGPDLFRDRHTIGYWFWDVEYVPPSVRAAADLVDELWVATPFTAEALRAAVDVPVRVVEIPVPEPRPDAGELDIDQIAGVAPSEPASRFTFLNTFDHLSVTERKNPIGAIEAFRLAFPEPVPGGPRLIVKSLNAAHRWADHERVRLATGGRPDIVITDRHLTRGQQLRLIADADCLVALHRSEGLGLHLLEAMWLCTPVIATRYSGNLHMMNDECSALVDATMVPVTRGEGYFPAQAVWADPDLEQAATWMRRMVHEPDLGARLAAAGRVRMLRQPSPAETGRRIAQLARERGGR